MSGEESLNWRKQYHDEQNGVITASNATITGGWFVLDDLSMGCWVAYYQPDDGSPPEKRTQFEVHRGGISACLAACENYNGPTDTT